MNESETKTVIIDFFKHNSKISFTVVQIICIFFLKNKKKEIINFTSPFSIFISHFLVPSYHHADHYHIRDIHPHKLHTTHPIH